MRRNQEPDVLSHQSGAALVIFLLIGVLTVLSLTLNRLSSLTNETGKRSTAQSLAQAKDAVIGWSASHATKPGMLPCPENTDLIDTLGSEGTAQTDCSDSAPSAGRLPWRTLKVPQLFDDAGEPLWYAISPGFRSPSKINGSSQGQLTVDGSANKVLAVIFSPGPPLSGQNRPLPTAALPPDIERYLEGYNLVGNGSFVSSGAADVFNDRLLTITHGELFRTVNRRVLSELRGDEATGLLGYFADNASFPPEGSDLPSVFSSLLSAAAVNFMDNNDWYSLLTYSVSADQQQATLTINAPTSMTCTITPGQSTCQ